MGGDEKGIWKRIPDSLIAKGYSLGKVKMAPNRQHNFAKRGGRLVGFEAQKDQGNEDTCSSDRAIPSCKCEYRLRERA